MADLEKTDQNNTVLMIPKKMVPSLRKFLRGNPDVLYRFILRKVKEAVEQNYDEVKLFYLGDTQTLATIRYDDYDRVLQDAMTHFITTEQYELAEKCKTTLISHSVEKLINSTKI